MTPIFMKKGTVFQNRFGVYKHDDIIGKEYGSKVTRKTQVHSRSAFIDDSCSMVVGLFKLQRVCLPSSPHTRALDARFTTPNTNFVYSRHFIHHHTIRHEAWRQCHWVRHRLWIVFTLYRSHNRTYRTTLLIRVSSRQSQFSTSRIQWAWIWRYHQNAPQRCL